MREPKGRIAALIVEDEPEARENLLQYSRAIEGLEITGQASSGREAVQMIDRLRPDLVFMDVCLPELTGLQVLEKIRHQPEVIFTTAHDRFALSAFELGALDYLLKPFGRGRFEKAVERVRERLPGLTVPSSERARDAFLTPLTRLFARTIDAIVPIDIRSVRHIQARGDYVEITCDSGRHLLQMTLAELKHRLDPEVFCQVHRSHIVNMDKVERLLPFDGRRLLVKLKDGTEIVASRTASEGLRRLVR